jgi:exosortase C (VPDSG-CTERM-specific)
LNRDAQLDSGMTPSPSPHSETAASARRLRGFGLATLVLVLCFSIPLWDLMQFARHSQFHSYILLIPFISVYLVWLKKGRFLLSSQAASKAGAVLLAAGVGVLLVYWLALRPRLKQVEDDYLAVMMISFLLFFWGVCGLFLGWETLRAVVFPLGLLLFMVPIPSFLMPPIDAFLQHGSAAAAQGFFMLAGTPFLRSGLAFQLPGINIQVAPECSGIQSSLVLLITGLLAGYLFLRRPWNRGLLALLMIPLGLLRNGFRVFTIGELCVHISPQMIDSPIHHRGGPIFFVLSLIPLFILLAALRISERAGRKTRLNTGPNPNPKPPE